MAQTGRSSLKNIDLKSDIQKEARKMIPAKESTALTISTTKSQFLGNRSCTRLP